MRLQWTGEITAVHGNHSGAWKSQRCAAVTRVPMPHSCLVNVPTRYDHAHAGRLESKLGHYNHTLVDFNHSANHSSRLLAV
jgi:hypothetical protein